MALTFNQTLAYTLGYSTRHFDPRYTAQPIVFPEFTEDDVAYIQKILDKLTAIDEELEANRKDSMATDVGGIKIDFHKNIQITKSEGTRLLKELERITDIPLMYDKYLGRTQSGLSSTPIVVRSYY